MSKIIVIVNVYKEKTLPMPIYRKRHPARKSIKKFIKRTIRPRKVYRKKHIPVGFPINQIVKLRYCETIDIDVPLAGTPTNYVFCANSLYDPNVTGIGHQPCCFDTYATMYNHYMVLGSKMTARFQALGTTGNFNAVVGIKLDDDASLTPITSMTTLIEQPNNLFKWKTMRSNATQTPNTVTVQNYYSPKKFFGIKDIKDNMDTLGALVTASPSETANYHVVVGTGTSDEDLSTVRVIVTIEYIVMFTEPKDMTSS